MADGSAPQGRGQERALRKDDQVHAGLLAERRGDVGAAEAAYRRAEELGDPHGAARLALLLSARDDWDGADAAWRRAEELGIEDAPALEPLEQLDDGDGAAPEVPVGVRRSVLASPVLIGAVTVLVALVAVFLAYNANLGLPFVPTKELKVELPDGSNLVVGNDVREGGYRIGVVSALTPARLPNGTFGAQVTLKLAEANGDVPVDSRVTVLSKSVLGLKFVDLIKGSSPHVFADGATLPVSQTSLPVQVDQVFGMFNPPTRTAIQQGLVGFGDTLASRGSSLNQTLGNLPPLLGYLRPVAAYLSAPLTQLTRFFTTLDTFMRTVVPVAGVNARLFGEMATTFEAVSRDPQALEATIADSPSTLSVSTSSLKAQQPFLTDFATLGHDLQPATSSLVQALPQVNPALEAGTRTLARTPALNHRLQQVMGALRSLALAPGTNIALNALTATATTLNPIVRYLGPYVTVCNDWNYWWTYLSEHISEATSFGFAQRALLMQSNSAQQNNVSSAGATAPVNGGVPNSSLGGDQYLHSQNYGAAVDTHGNADCETGQRGYPRQLNYFDPQHRLLAVDPHTPGDQGPTFTGRAHVPAGETFSRNPQTGPQLAYNPKNP